MVQSLGGTSAGPPANGRWSLRLLGGFRLTDPSGVEATGLGRLDRALLAYLVLCRQQQLMRARVADMLWPNRSEALRSLTVSLNVLRKALGDKDGAVIALKADPLAFHLDNLDVDVVAFEALVSQGTPEALAEAEGLCAGNLLDGLDVRSEEFNHWLVPQRERLRDLRIGCLCRLMRHREEAGQTQEALTTARLVLELDDLREEAHCTIIRIHLANAQRAAARRHAQQCEEILRRENIEPEAETVRLIAESRQPGSVQTRPPAPPASPVDDKIEPRSPTTEPNSSRRVVASLRMHIGRWRLWLRIVGSLLGILAITPLTIGAIYRKNPELLPAWIANIVIPLQSIDPRPLRPSIAVTPFKVVGDDPMATQLAGGITEAITTALSIASDIRVVSSYSVRSMDETPMGLTSLANKLHVRYLLLGTVQQSSDRVLVNVQLTDTGDEERLIWGHTYDLQLGNFIDLQKSITLEVITALQVALTKGEEERINLEHGTRSLEAWLEASQGEINLRDLTAQDNSMARAHYKNSLAFDPKYPGALAGLAWTDLVDARFGWSTQPPEVLLKEASDLARQAYEIDPNRSRTLALLGTIALISCDLHSAVDYGEKAVEMEPNDADSAALLAYTLTYAGEPNRAVNLMEKAMKLSPYYPSWYRWLLGRANRIAGHDRRALPWLTAANDGNFESLGPLVELTVVYMNKGQATQAHATAQRVKNLNPRFSVAAWMRTPCYSDPATGEQEKQALIAAGLPE